MAVKHTLLYISLLLIVVAATGCHSNEQNYREAYNKVVEQRKTGIGGETYAKIDAERRSYTELIDGDSVRLVHVYANVAVDTTVVAKPYNVVVASFAQRINAKSYCERLRKECGLPSYILYGGPEKKFYVVAQGFDDKIEAARYLRDIDKKMCIKVVEPLAWILKKI